MSGLLAQAVPSSAHKKAVVRVAAVKERPGTCSGAGEGPHWAQLVIACPVATWELVTGKYCGAERHIATMFHGWHEGGRGGDVMHRDWSVITRHYAPLVLSAAQLLVAVITRTQKPGQSVSLHVSSQELRQSASLMQESWDLSWGYSCRWPQQTFEPWEILASLGKKYLTKLSQCEVWSQCVWFPKFHKCERLRNEVKTHLFIFHLLNEEEIMTKAEKMWIWRSNDQF